MTGVLLLAAVLWCIGWWQTAPAVAAIGALLIALGHSIFLLVEFMMLVRVSRADEGAMPPAWHRIATAWWCEIWQDVRVFAWRQPYRWRTVPDCLEPGLRGRQGVVLIHGFMCNRGFWTPWLMRLRREGHPFVAVNLEPPFAAIDDYFPAIERAVQQVTQASGLPPLLLCHSMGGLAARAWLRRAESAGRVRHVVTIGTPHTGTWLARFSRLPSGRQMRQDSPWLQALQAEERSRQQPPFTCWYSDCDNVVFPPRCATLPYADNRLLPGFAHVDLAFHPAVMDAVVEMLKER